VRKSPVKVNSGPMPAMPAAAYRQSYPEPPPEGACLVDTVIPGYSAGDLRVSDADRDRAISELSEHCQAGRLTADEFDERSSQALQARTGKELAVLFADLPRGRAGVTGLPSPGPAPAVRIGMAAPVLVGVFVSLVVFAYSQHGLLHHPAFALNLTPLVPTLVVLLVIGCLTRRRYRRDRWERRGLRFDDREDV
jgi:DUF1707 SHOCT-like domain